eukprot:s3756_g4.t1
MDTLPQEGPPTVLDRSGSVDAEETLPQEGPVVVLDSSESEDADLCVLVHFWPEDGALVYYDPQQKAMVLEYTEHADAAALPGCDDQVPGLCSEAEVLAGVVTHGLEAKVLAWIHAQVTTKVPPSYDGRSSWFAYEDAIDDWCDVTELGNDKRGPALRSRLGGEAAIHKRLLDRERLKDPNNGVKYFKSFLRPLFVKGAANVFLYRFQQFMNLHRGNRDMLRWITRFQLSVQRMQEAWNDTYLPITDPNNVEDQRQVLTSLMAHRNRVLADYCLNELREVYLEIFCTTKTSVDPLPAPSGHGGRKTVLGIDEGYLDNHEGYWVEDDEGGFLETDDDTFWVYDEENYTWFQRRFQGRKMRRGFKGGRRKGKGKGGKGSGGRRFFKKRKGRSNLADDQTDAWQAEGLWQDSQWQDQSWDDWSWYESEEAYAAKGKGKKGSTGTQDVESFGEAALVPSLVRSRCPPGRARPPRRSRLCRSWNPRQELRTGDVQRRSWLKPAPYVLDLSASASHSHVYIAAMHFIVLASRDGCAAVSSLVTRGSVLCAARIHRSRRHRDRQVASAWLLWVVPEAAQLNSSWQAPWPCGPQPLQMGQIRSLAGDVDIHLYEPIDVTFDSQGALYVADNGNARVVRWCAPSVPYEQILPCAAVF